MKEDNNYLELYVIVDRVSGCRVTGIIPCVNVGVALNGFKSFIKEEEDKGMSPKMYTLRYLGKLHGEGKIYGIDENMNICNGDQAEERFNAWCETALEEEDC